MATQHTKPEELKTPPEKSERVVFIDILRGYAILMMLQGHAVVVVLGERYQDVDHWFYGFLFYLRGMTAPTFFLASGMIFSYLMLKKESAGMPYARKGINRALWLIVIGTILKVKMHHFHYLKKGEWVEAFSFLGQSHVLHTIGIGLILMVVLRKLFQGSLFHIITGVSAFLLFFFGGYVSYKPLGVFRVLETFTFMEYATFPVLPWCGFILSGAVLGSIGWEKKWFTSPRAIFLVILAGGLTLLVSKGMMYLNDDLFPYKIKSAVSFWRGGEVIIFSAVVALVCYWLQRIGKMDNVICRVIRQSGSETFVIFVAHTILLYGNLTNHGINRYLDKALDPLGTLVFVIAFVGFFIWLAYQFPQWRKRFPWMKHLR